MNIFMWYRSEMFMRLMNCNEHIVQKLIRAGDAIAARHMLTRAMLDQAELSRSSFQLHCHEPVYLCM